MDLSEFKPPVRLSMSDEEIYQALGAAQANEDGLARAMAIVEEQANLREHDNQLFAEWVARMQTSDAPQAKIALENIQRVSQGLEPLPITANPEIVVPVASVDLAPVDDIVAALNAAHSSSAPEPVVEEIVEPETEDEPVSIFASLADPVVEPVVESVFEPTVETIIELAIEVPQTPVHEPSFEEEFDQLLADASSEATTSIMVSGISGEPAVTFESDEPENFAVSADEDALVEEELKTAPQTGSGWWQNAAFWVVSVGVFAPVLVAFLLVASKVTFATAAVSFGIALALNLGFVVSAHFTSKRTAESSVVASRATFGVLGAAIPTAGLLVLSVGLLILVATTSSGIANQAFDFGVSAGDQVVTGITFGQLIALGAVFVAVSVTAFAKQILGWINAVAAGFLVIAFVVAALLTRDQIDFAKLDLNVDLAQAALLGAIIAVFLGVLTYGKAPRVLGSHNGKSNTTARWAAVVGATVVLPLAVFAHFSLVIEQHGPWSEFNILSSLGLVQQTEIISPIVWVIVAGLFVLLINLAEQAVGLVRGFGANDIPRWVYPLAGLILSASLCVLPATAKWLDLGAIAFVPVAASTGFAVADSIMRRGLYHEASLLRGYGFYGKFNLVGLLGYAAIVAVGWGFTSPNDFAPWLGYFGPAPLFIPALALLAGLLWNLATGAPRVAMQQREVAEVELRKASLSEFSGFTE